ncbi:MAG: hypothetical protein LUF30_12715, partial [Lachnospiraceae bacterium]|nr:hypothetical protein [Lachnospiraceae bacterium]
MTEGDASGKTDADADDEMTGESETLTEDHSGESPQEQTEASTDSTEGQTQTPTEEETEDQTEALTEEETEEESETSSESETDESESETEEKLDAVKIGDTIYGSIAEALATVPVVVGEFDMEKDTATEIVLLMDLTENITIETGKNVRIDLAGHTLSGDGTSCVIMVYGMLELTDSSCNATSDDIVSAEAVPGGGMGTVRYGKGYRDGDCSFDGSD